MLLEMVIYKPCLDWSRIRSRFGAAVAILCTTSETVKKSSSKGLLNLFKSEWLRASEYFVVASDTSRQPEFSLTMNLCVECQ
jgi:hypothetical protein